jgi:hypothetical protein
MKSETKQCQNCQRPFTIEPEDFGFYEKMKVPAPTWCPKCRAMRRLNFWNEHNLFRREDTLTGKEIFSTYSRSAPVPVYDRDYWYSDAWDPLEYGRDYDFSKPFFAQLDELRKTVPWPSKSVRDMVNSDYCDQASSLKNSYLCFNGGYSEDCLYGVAFTRMTGSAEFYATVDSDQCFSIYQTDKSYRAFFSEGCEGCRDVWFCLDCLDCSNCFGCVGLRHKQYHIFNNPHSPEKYREELQRFNLDSYAAITDMEKRFEEFRLKFPKKYIHSTHSQDVSGDYVYNSKNARYSYEVGDLEDSKFVECIKGPANNCYDFTNWGQNVNLLYESIVCGDNCERLKFCLECWPACREMEYCMNCHSCANCFGCVGLKKKQYCVFNRQYSREDYEKLVSKIRTQMDETPYTDAKGHVYRYGEFFPAELSATGYNDSKSQEYYPLTKEEALARGLFWLDIERQEFQTTMSAGNLADRIADVPDSILDERIGCLNCGRAYRVVVSELAFHRRFNLPLSRFCFGCRYTKLLKHRNPLSLHRRQCQCAGKASDDHIYENMVSHRHGDDHCSNEFETSYAPDRPEIIYCENCYNSETV